MNSANPSSASGQEFVSSRVLNAPRDLVWRAFSEAERLAQWWGPVGFTIDVAKLDFRPGGVFHYCMKSPLGDMWGRFTYVDIAAPERIVFLNAFSDPQGGLTRAPFTGTWPLEVHNTLTLVEESGRTTLTLRGRPVDASEAEIATFEAGFESMRQGFGGTWDQLEAYLSRNAQ